MGVPQSTIYFCQGVGIANDYKHTFYFESKEEQYNFFASKVALTKTGYTYLRRNRDIDIDVPFELASTYDYLYFVNESKYYYYFITSHQYKSDGVTTITIELDVLQTYHFNYELNPCFVEREHSMTDNIGDNLVPENLDMGELTIIDETWAPLTEAVVLIMSSVSLTAAFAGVTFDVTPTSYNGVFSALKVYQCTITNMSELNTLIAKLDNEGLTECIFSMWMYPRNLINYAMADEDKNVQAVTSARSVETTVTMPAKLAGDYIPQNAKLYTYPFNFLYVSDNNGGAATYRYEYFKDPSEITLKLYGAISPDAAVALAPMNYKGSREGTDESITLKGFPSCAWKVDTYKLWLAQNQNQQQLTGATSALSIVGGVATAAVSAYMGNVAGIAGGAVSAISGAQQIAQLMAQRKDMEVQPPQARGAHSTTVNFSHNHHNFLIQKKSLTADYLKRIDNYFTLYGYQTNAIKIPERHAREYWSYTKTVDCSISGNIPNDDKLKICECYNKGVTWWRDFNHIGEYRFMNSNNARA